MTVLEQCATSVKRVLPTTFKICIWILKTTVMVTFAMMVLQYLGVIDWLSGFLSPVFKYFGLPGSAAFAFVSGYFVNTYSAIAVALSIGLDARAMTILAVMSLCAHNMIVETSVQTKTGTSPISIFLTRTISAVVLGFILNLLLPGTPQVMSEYISSNQDASFLTMLQSWAVSTFKVALKIIVIIFSLNIIQGILVDFGVMEKLSKVMKPFLWIFGLPEKASFFFIIANVVGLAYGGAALYEESQSGRLSKDDIDLINAHIGISHSNLEDLILFSTVGGIWWIILLVRWAAAALIVWGMRLFRQIA